MFLLLQLGENHPLTVRTKDTLKVSIYHLLTNLLLLTMLSSIILIAKSIYMIYAE